MIFQERFVAEVDSELVNSTFHDLTKGSVHLPMGLHRLIGLNFNFVPSPYLSFRHRHEEWIGALQDLERSIKLRFQFGSRSSDNYIKALYVPNKSYVPTTTLPPKFTQWFKNAYATPYPTVARRRYNLPFSLRHQLGLLLKRNDLVFVASDKNLGPAVLSSTQYRNLCLKHLNGNPDVYSKVKDYSPIQIAEKIRTLHLKLSTRFPEDKRLFRILIHELSTKTAAKFRILPKLHKVDHNGNWTEAVRPILNSRPSPTYGLSKFLEYMLRPYVKRSSTYLQDSDQLLKEMKTLPQLPPKARLITLDAESLYTSIPLAEAMKVASTVLKDHPMFPLLMEGLAIVLYKNFFYFETQVFHQQRGVAMGTPLGPTLANLFLGYFEETHLVTSHLWNNEILLCKRYIDDLFLVWCDRPDRKHQFNYFQMLLRRQPGISWTTTESGCKEIPFLDLSISIDPSTRGIITKTHQKKLNLHLYVPAYSAHAPGALRGLVTGLLLKYKRQNTFIDDFHQFKQLLATRLLARGYSATELRQIFDNVLRSHIYSNTNTTTSSEKLFFKLTFDPNGASRSKIYSSLQLERLQKLILDHNLGKVLICFKRSKNLGDILSSSKHKLPSSTSFSFC